MPRSATPINQLTFCLYLATLPSSFIALAVSTFSSVITSTPLLAFLFSLLDHRNINYCELLAALFALTENQNQVHSVHCNSEFIHDTLFRKSHFDQDFECVSPSHSCCSCVTSNITKLQLPVFNTQTSLVDFYPTGEEHFSPSRSEELSLLPNSISPIFCEGLDRAEITTIELTSKSHSLVSTNLIDCLSDSSQESMSAPESSVCSPASKQRFVEDETLHLIELEDNVNESNPMQDYSHCKDDLSYLNQTYTRVPMSFLYDH